MIKVGLTSTEQGAIEFTSNGGSAAKGKTYENIRILNVSMEGKLRLRGVKNCTVSGGKIDSGVDQKTIGIADLCENIFVTGTNAEGKRLYDVTSKNVRYSNIGGSELLQGGKIVEVTSGQEVDTGLVKGSAHGVLRSILCRRFRIRRGFSWLKYS